MTDTTLEHWPLDRLVPYDRNPRKNEHVIDTLCGMIREYGFKVPIVAKADGTIVDGHLRFKAARRLDLETVPVIPADDLSDTQIKALRLALNKSAELADWDDELLRLELLDLGEAGFDLALTGFDLGEIEALTVDKSPPDDFPDVDENIDTEHECPKCGYRWSGG